MPKLGKTIKDVIRGDSRIIHCYFYEKDGTTPIPLTGGTVYFTVNTSSDPADDTGAAIQRTATDATPFTAPLLGLHTFTLTPTNTSIDAGTYWYDSEFVDGVGAKLSAYRGKFLVTSDITRT